MNTDNQRHIWERVYKKYSPHELPWLGIKFPKEIVKYLNLLDKKEPLLIVGCGVGDVVATCAEMGFKQPMGTDISNNAISQARKRFPKLKFERIETEKLGKKGYKNANVFDWVNLHQIKPKDLNNYLKSLQKIVKT